jgi:hypothetical protein
MFSPSWITFCILFAMNILSNENVAFKNGGLTQHPFQQQGLLN